MSTSRAQILASKYHFLHSKKEAELTGEMADYSAKAGKVKKN